MRIVRGNSHRWRVRVPLSAAIHFFHIMPAAIFVMWEAVLDVVSDIFHGIVSARLGS